MISGMVSGIVSGIVSSTHQEVTMANSEKVRENRLRAAAQRQALRLVKSRRRDPRAFDYGHYMLVDEQNRVVTGTQHTGHPNLDLDDVEAYLTGGSA